MPAISIQTAFQGGGAKLGTLIAAAKSLHEAQKRGDFLVTRIAGTSAGAIVAAMLASGHDPSIFAARVRELAPKYLGPIVRKRHKLLRGYDFVQGVPLFDTQLYRTFLRELFTVDGRPLTYVSDLKGIEHVYFYSTDVRTRKPRVFEKTSAELLVDALFHSSALPFIFASFKDMAGLIDGGIINNFPANILDKPKEFGEVVGFSFPRSEIQMEHSSAASFAKSIVETMMDNAVDLALSRLDSRNIHLLDTKTTTLQFDEALRDDLGTDFQRHVKGVDLFLDGVKKRMWLEGVGLDQVNALDRIDQYYRAVSKDDLIDVPIVKTTYRCNALKDHDPSKLDECTVELELVPRKRPARTFSFQIGVASHSFHEKANELGIHVTDSQGRSIDATIIPVVAEISGLGTPAAKIIILFHEELAVGNQYRLSFSAPTSEVLYDLTASQKTDFVRFSLNVVDRVEKLYLIAYVPSEFKNVELVDWNKPAAKETWKTGQQMSRDEVQKIASPLGGFHVIGWTAENLVRGNAAGFKASIP
ncbi:patatin-like phospholipase family protein [Rhizobium rhizogenes]|uniref:PNPLA domain-containing protein n=1 Tax=Rhizobium rhizogenes NBRC 13257 TaxID=1220581 RepID=A0AA87PXX5_RHIRH|nr:patatin-like phospholipase family protein [Rhizobium rhizogenes]NTG60135.1 patatin-like phospholipase family protein [Rhizobium rhizogenes]NTG66686.1 patatin-like phospholipase family protein [Rhizobium rhizogenes]NTG79658.1 patatin-like phospholipase family protein [Rhizobium rhizogenes]NTH95338.1 patatin-like phospholipase family protein [Rhizobium rhizogenes]NTI67549.1 patatin-like phospholipase family protein [Rhizobium rhizogenes]